MPKQLKACKNCGNFRPYYEKTKKSFIQTNKGRCSVLKEIINEQGFYEEWRNTFTFLSDRKEQVFCALEQVLVDLSAIRQILEEENENIQTHPKHSTV